MTPITDQLRAALEKADALQQRIAGLAAGPANFAALAEAVQPLAPILAEVRRAALETCQSDQAPPIPELNPIGPTRANVPLDRDEFEAILRSLADGITVLDEHGRLAYVNEAAARVAGYASADHMRQRHTVSPLLDEFELRDAQGQPFPLDQLPNRQLLGMSPRPQPPSAPSPTAYLWT